MEQYDVEKFLSALALAATSAFNKGTPLRDEIADLPKDYRDAITEGQDVSMLLDDVVRTMNRASRRNARKRRKAHD